MAEKIAHNLPVLLIGLGRFGYATATELVTLGREVLVIERDSNLVQKNSRHFTHIIEADATNIDTLREVGAQDFAAAVVAVGTSIESSVLITANLVDLEIKQIWVKAITISHGKILERIGATNVIYPEADAGSRVAHLVSGRMLDFIEFDEKFALAKMYPPKEICGIYLGGVRFHQKYGINVIAIKRVEEDFVDVELDTQIKLSDIIIVSGKASLIQSFASKP